MSKHDEFRPDWFEGEVPENSWRRAFYWGDPYEHKHPNRRLYKLMKETFGMTDEDFEKPRDLGLGAIDVKRPTKLSKKTLGELAGIVGEENVRTDEAVRVKVAYGKTMIDAMRLREKNPDNLPEAVIWPRDKRDAAALVDYCARTRLPLHVYGGGSSVTRGVECTTGGIQLDMRVHMNRVLHLNETNQTVTVEPGISGPQLEEALRHSKQIFGTRRNFTCGHFPQSFEYSAAGGWVVTRGAGQNSTYYGKIEDLVVCQEYATPAGVIKTKEYPAMSTGPSVDQIMMGSEGAFGVLTEVTLKIYRYMPQNTRRFSFIFPTWEKGLTAVREIMQGEFGFPSVFRLSDPEETDIALKLYGVEGTPIDTLMKLAGYKKGERCLFLGTSDGDADFTRLVAGKVKRVSRAYGGMSTTSYVTRSWEKGRFKDPYLREDMLDYGIVTDTLECAVNWEQLPAVHAEVRKFAKSRPGTICTTHTSHCYPQGANLYFIFIGRMDKKEYIDYQRGMLDAIQRSGASMSHHHGIGKLIAPWLEGQIGRNQLEIFKALKKHFDPDNVMNPGGTLALDMPEKEKRFAK